MKVQESEDLNSNLITTEAWGGGEVLSLLLNLPLLRGSSPGSPVFFPPQKPALLNSNSTWMSIRAIILLGHGYYVLPCLSKSNKG